MYNEILRIAADDFSSYPWAEYVPNNFSEEQINVFKFILDSFPENVLINDGELNSDVISVLAMMAYDIGESREFIKNIKISKDIKELYDKVETNRILSSEPTAGTERVGDTYIYNDGTKDILKRYVGFTWDEGATLASVGSLTPPTFPTEGEYWYSNEEEKLYLYRGEYSKYINGSWVTVPAGWEEIFKFFFKAPKTPNYNDLWVNIKDEKVYSYTQAFWEEVPLYKNNMKLLLSLLQDMNFSVLDEEEKIEDKEKIIKNYELLAKDSYKIIRNRGTIKTIERIVSSFIRSENDNTLVDFNIYIGDGEYTFLDEPSEVSPLEVGTILIDIPNLEDYPKLSYLLDTNLGEIAGSPTKYTLQLRKDNYLYKTLMRVKPAGINYLLVSSNNLSASYSTTLEAPEVQFVSANYGDKSYTLRVTNPNNHNAILNLVDYGASGFGGTYTYTTIISPYQILAITREADNEDFIDNGTTTTIQAFLESTDGAIGDSVIETVDHVADSQLVNTNIASFSKGSNSVSGYVNAFYRNNNDITVNLEVTLNWLDNYWDYDNAFTGTPDYQESDPGFIDSARYGVNSIIDADDPSRDLGEYLELDIAYLRTNGDTVVLRLLNNQTTYDKALTIETGMEYNIEGVCDLLATEQPQYYNNAIVGDLPGPTIFRLQYEEDSYVYYELLNTLDVDRYRYYEIVNTEESKVYSIAEDTFISRRHNNPSDRLQNLTVSAQLVDPLGERDSSEVYTETINNIARTPE
jgi:hypothetical protein